MLQAQNSRRRSTTRSRWFRTMLKQQEGASASSFFLHQAGEPDVAGVRQPTLPIAPNAPALGTATRCGTRPSDGKGSANVPPMVMRASRRSHIACAAPASSDRTKWSLHPICWSAGAVSALARSCSRSRLRPAARPSRKAPACRMNTEAGRAVAVQFACIEESPGSAEWDAG